MNTRTVARYAAPVASEAVWTIPEPRSVQEVQVDDDTVIVVRRHGNPDGTRLILCHGNGLAIDFYYPFWSLLTDEFDVVVYDLRSHGWNPVGPLSGHTLPSFVEDFERVLDAVDHHYGTKQQIGVFHSVSSFAPLLSSTKGTRFAGLVLFDPPLRKPGTTSNEFDQAAERGAQIASRRIWRFTAKEDFVSRMNVLPTFKNAVPGTAELMAETTLRESSDDPGYELRCPRDHEAQIIAYVRLFAVLIDFNALECPTKVIGADPTLPFSFLPTLDLSEMATVDYDFLPDTSHFLQFEQPTACADAVRRFLKSTGLA
ncbi:MAG: alpha/beta hydrolase [Acidimicrobiales bacterium]|nr:alpha/beta hydrolase [Acidimicrobiales bacterium]MXY04157.1 alpha/beta hydrolase [Acidimicrobiales bacterium]MXZ15137.1 alpha/beta hydrolase [Acidimicrobiales bacterium]MYA26789.1 alpha/beta hydrolase [Acidimicrobiales bacterium]MYA83385.1 alpha/beta hydrolase [Acidimicrobiales bacterium]